MLPGYCLGGTLLTCTLAYLKARGDERIGCATLLASLLDFTEPGELQHFLNIEQIEYFETLMTRNGLWGGRKMATAFNMIQADENIWPYWNHRYLKGQKPIKHAALYWVSDLTHTTAPLYSFYMRKMYLENVLKEPGGIAINGTAIDFKCIDVPVYYLGIKDDTISPLKAAVRSQQLLANARLVVSEGGHYSAVTNPAGSKKLGFWCDEQRLEMAPEVRQPGSWWNDWAQWLVPHAGVEQGSKPLNTKLPDSPGSYVQQVV